MGAGPRLRGAGTVAPHTSPGDQSSPRVHLWHAIVRYVPFSTQFTLLYCNDPQSYLTNFVTKLWELVHGRLREQGKGRLQKLYH